jgi:hypothetical protein
MVYDGIILSILIGFLRKGSLKGLAHLNLKFGFIFPLLLAFQIAIFYLQNKMEFIGRLSGVFYIFVYIAGLIFLYINRKEKGFILIFIGVFLNFLVMALNGGRMPVSLEAAALLDPMYKQALQESLYAKHQALNEATHLGFLGDVIPITKPYPKTQVISIGDIVMNIGVFLFIQNLMVHKSKPFQHIQNTANMH